MGGSRYAKGYIMLPVVLGVVLVATIAFMMNFEGAHGVKRISSELVTEKARYVTEAGLQHALWQTEKQGCGPYTDFTNQAIGNHSYTTTLTTDLGSITSYPITVDQDTWIRSDNLTNNNSGDSKLHIRFEGGAIERPMFRYDLSSLPVNAAIHSAIAWFYVSKEHSEGPVDIHRLTGDWTETDATWQTMGTNMDSAVLATIPAQPTSGVWIPINLTNQVQAWVNGEANYGITLNSTSEGTHGDYASREASNKPYLEVTVGIPPSSPATLTAVGTLANGVTRTILRNDVVLRQKPAQYSHWQHDASLGVDAEIWAQSPDNNYADMAEMWVSSASNDTTRSLLHFNTSAIPAGARILEATLSLRRQSGSGSAQPVSAHRIQNPWSEESVTWNRRKSGINWDTPGGDFDSTAVATTPVGPANTRYAWNITPLAQGWVDGSYPNYGVVLIAAIAGMAGERFHTSDDADPSRWPSLSITYACECGVACLTPQGSGKVLMIVDYVGFNLNPADQHKKELIESWGYSVGAYDNNFLWLVNFNNFDVIYISATASDSVLVDQLKNKTNGIVYELTQQNNDLGMASDVDWPVGTDITIVDTSHEITALFAAGPLTIKTADSYLSTLNGQAAADAQILAEVGGAGGLIALETGAALGGDAVGEFAAGRRVMLPVGLTIDGDWRHLNNNGLLIIQRAIEWGAYKDPISIGSSIWLSTLDNVSGSGAPGLDDWTDGEVIAFADPNLTLEPGTTDGTFSPVLNLDDFAGNVDINAMHYVGSNITVGSTNSVDLQTGDLLLSTADNETLDSLNSLSVNDEDVFVFRPVSEGDYSSGTFIFLIDGSRIHEGDDTVGITLVEKDTLVGDRTLAAGSFLMAIDDGSNVMLFPANDVGLNTSAGGFIELIDGSDLDFDDEIGGLELAEDENILGGHTIPAGAILMKLDGDNSRAGDNRITVNSEDIFYLTVTRTGSSSAANATLLFDGGDVNLNTSGEHLQAITLTNSPAEPGLTLPIAHWKLDETSGITAVDSEGGHDGTLNNGPVWTTGQIGGALDFDGNNDAIRVPHADTLSLTDTMTFVAWVNASSFGWNYQTIISKDDGVSPGSNFWFGTWQQEPVFGFFANGSFREVFPTGLNLQAGTWYQLAASFDNATDTVRLYVDGAEVHSGTLAFNPSVTTADVAIGRSPIGEYWRGLLDDVRIYDSVLPASEIAELYAEGGGEGGGGGTPEPPPVDGSCNGTYRDEFNAQSFSGSDGTLDWSSTAWSEVGESDGATSGDVRVRTDQSNYQLRIRDNNNGGEGVERLVNLNGAIKAALTFHYRRMNLDSSTDYVELSISSTGTGGPWTSLDQIGTSNDSTYQSNAYDISDYISANTAIRLRSSSSMGGTDTVWFDNVQVECVSLAVVPIDPMEPTPIVR
ncbi:MAG: DNRLRE domain-containing protein [Candidatus Thiodiazotropha sp.]|nr:DNRLRE domain-containing protein [Candidatus Thiodiazotropha sp.]MCM8883130.1 DNRLRE domain-containing protein [Candidatus Thiodiazotropha sp.]MCM8921859.1 DNRLRE domain-containing protein [Candidatus Thiodiazotropha sp.]